MALNGIDVASYQASLNLDNVSYDFVCIKATEGSTYVNPHCDTHFQEAKAAGKKRAVYHFTNFGDPIVEANFFVDNCSGYIRDAIFVLDWEGTDVDRTDWVLQFLRHVESRIGYKPAIYMSEWVENAYDWSAVVAGDYGLWLAKYSNYEIAHNYDMSNAGTQPTCVHWPFYFMWQWTSKGQLSGYAGNLDCDIAYLNSSGWDAYAGILTTNGNVATASVPDAPPVSLPAAGDVPQPLPAEPAVVVPEPTPVTPVVVAPAAPETPAVPSPVAVLVPGTVITPTPVPGTPALVVEQNKQGTNTVKNALHSFVTNDTVRRVFHAFWQAALGVLVAHYLAPAQPTDVKVLVIGAVAAGASAAKSAVVAAWSK